MISPLVSTYLQAFGQSDAQVLVVLGPTASGKSSLAVQIAHHIKGEVISADSRQVYRGMDIGTGKVTEEEKEGIPHFGLDIASPGMVFTVADYAKYAEDTIQEILSRGKVPIIAGGTGLYINALVLGLNLGASSDPKVRELLEQELAAYGALHMYDQLKKVDPLSAEQIGSKNERYILRALEIYRVTGVPKSKQVQSIPEQAKNYFIIGLAPSRERLYEKINTRHAAMFDNDQLVKETKNLLDMGYKKEDEAMSSIGYRECLAMIDGTITRQEALEKVQQGARHYAKRQMTWFRRLERQVPIHWIS